MFWCIPVMSLKGVILPAVSTPQHCTKVLRPFAYPPLPGTTREFAANPAGGRMRQTADGSSDHYEALQLSPNADSETVDRVYRILAKRYHPDNQQTGDATKFGMIADAHRVLSDPEQRAAYDARYEENRGAVLKIIDEASGSNAFTTDQRIFEAILSLLY